MPTPHIYLTINRIAERFGARLVNRKAGLAIRTRNARERDRVAQELLDEGLRVTFGSLRTVEVAI